MKTSWNETRLIEAYLQGALPAEEHLLMDARQILQPDFQKDISLQQKTHDLVRQYGRQQLKKEIAAADQAMFTQSKYQSFRQKISRLFSK